MACDICGEIGGKLVPLLDGYKTDEINHICSKCETVINNKQRDVRIVTNNIMKDWVKRFMTNLKTKHKV